MNNIREKANSRMQWFKSAKLYLSLQLQPIDTQSDVVVYTLDAGALPSHIRTTFLAAEKYSEAYPLWSHTNKRRLRNRNPLSLTICLGVLTFILFLLASIFMVYAFREEMTKKLQSGHAENNSDKSEKNRNVSHTADINDTSMLIGDDQRYECMDQCWTYAAFRFKSKCVKGFCECNGHDYGRFTCLPKVDGYIIRTNASDMIGASFLANPQTTFQCLNVKAAHGKVYVFAVDGNRRTHNTTVDIDIQPAENITIVLVNQYRVTWVLKIPNDAVDKIVVMSNTNLASTDVIFHTESRNKKHTVEKLYALTGYGNDKDSGHTPELIKTILGRYGAIAAFVGAHYADHFYIRMGEKDVNRPNNVES